VFLQVFTDQIKRPHPEPGIDAPRRSFIRAGQNKRRERPVVVYEQIARLRDIHPLFISAVEHVAAELKKGSLSKNVFERLQLQATDKHKVVVIVDRDVAAVAVENSCIIRQQILLLRPNAGERFPPEFGTDLPIWRDCARWQRALDR
jgi:hypothetical protein